MWWASIVGSLVEAIVDALSGEPDLDAFEQAVMNARRELQAQLNEKRALSDALARKEIGQ